jgi:hypothetical protein
MHLFTFVFQCSTTMVFLFSALFSTSGYSITPVKKDPVIVKIRKSIPNGWSVKVRTGRLIFERKGITWIRFENTINAPVDFLSKRGKAKPRGRKGKTRVIYRYERRWTKKKFKKIKLFNKALLKKISSLPDKFTITHLKKLPAKSRFMHRKIGRDDFAKYVGRSKQEKQRVRKYYAMKQRLQAKIVIMPHLHSKWYSLYYVNMEGASDELQKVTPEKASKEAYTVMNVVNKYLQKH